MATEARAMRKFRWRRFRPRIRRWAQINEVAEQQSQLQKLISMTPKAVRAQNSMDKHRGGYRNREARLMELITFNDLLVDVVLDLPLEERADFSEKLYRMMQTHCQKHREPMFRREQFDAIIHGLSREIALFMAAKAHDFDVHMTSRMADGLGVDMQIRHPHTKRYVNIDCKTPSAFRHRIYDLLREGRLSEEEAAQAVIGGMTRIKNGRGTERVAIVLLRVSPEEFGEIKDFAFVDTARAAKILERVIELYGQHDSGFYRFVPEVD